MTRLRRNERRELNQSDEVYLISRGKGDLFLEKGEGPLVFLASVEEGGLMFGFPRVKNEKVILIPSQDIEFERIEFLEWMNRDVENRVPKFLAWIHHFDPFFLSHTADSIDFFAGKKKQMSLSVGKKLSSALPHFPEYNSEIRWVKLNQGECALFDSNDLKMKIDQVFPLQQSVWLIAKSDAELSVLTTEEACQDRGFKEGLKLFHDYFLRLRLMDLSEESVKDEQNAILRKSQDQGMIEISLKKVGSFLGSEETWTFPKLADPLYKACFIVGQRLDIHFEENREIEKIENIHDKLSLLCRSSKVGYRKVKLTPEWWKHDSLSLLGLLGKEKKPVALIDRKGHDYILIDPETGERTGMNKETAQQLHEEAYAFSPSFPKKKLSGKNILHFAFSKYKDEFLSLFAIGVVGALLALAPPFLNQFLFNDVVRPYDSTLLAQIIWGLVLATISIGIFQFVRSYAVLRLLQLVDVKLEPAFWSRILSLPVSFFRNFMVGTLVQRVFAISEIRLLIKGNVIRVIFSGLFSFFYFIAMVYYSYTLAFIGLGVILFGGIISVVCLARKNKIQEEQLSIDGDLRGTVVQMILGVSKVRVSGAEARMFSYWADRFSKYQDLTYNAKKYDTFIYSLLNALPTLTMGLMFLALVSHKPTLLLGDFIAFLAAYIPFSMAVYDGIQIANSLIMMIPLWERAKVLTEVEPENESTKEKPGKLRGEIVIDHLSFQYEKEGNMILDNVSLSVNPGEFIALVGPSGSGKSTIVRMLLGFESPLTGGVYFDGKNLSKLDLTEVRRQIGTVLQNGAIFSGSIYENIVCGGLYTQAEVMEALKLSGFDKDLESFPMGLQTVVQSGGGTLSTGQGQRLLISRALISKPKILIFDEATSALDNKTQEEVSKRLEEIEVTRVVVAHRLSTIKNANRIYVLEKGKIVQVGTFLELGQQEGIFKEMLKRQML